MPRIPPLDEILCCEALEDPDEFERYSDSKVEDSDGDMEDSDSEEEESLSWLSRSFLFSLNTYIIVSFVFCTA